MKITITKDPTQPINFDLGSVLHGDNEDRVFRVVKSPIIKGPWELDYENQYDLDEEDDDIKSDTVSLCTGINVIPSKFGVYVVSVEDNFLFLLTFSQFRCKFRGAEFIMEPTALHVEF